MTPEAPDALLEHSDMALDLRGVRLKLAHPRLRTRASVVVSVLPEEPAHGRQDREWNHDRSEDDERRPLIAGGGKNIRSSSHEVILHRCGPPAPNDDSSSKDTPRIGLWLDTSDQASEGDCRSP